MKKVFPVLLAIVLMLFSSCGVDKMPPVIEYIYHSTYEEYAEYLSNPELYGDKFWHKQYADFMSASRIFIPCYKGEKAQVSKAGVISEVPASDLSRYNCLYAANGFILSLHMLKAKTAEKLR